MTSSSRSRGGAVRVLFTTLIALLAVWFLWRVLGQAGLGTIKDRMLGADVALLSLATLLTILRYLVLALRWEVLARREAPVGFGQIAPVLMAGNFLSLVTPAVRIAGPILRAWYLSRETGRPRARFYGTIVADQASNFTVYAAVFAICGAMVTMPGSFHISRSVGVMLMAALVGGLSVGYWMLREVAAGRPSLLARAIRAALGEGPGDGWKSRLIVWWEHLLHSLSGSVLSPGTWWPAMALSCLAYAMAVATQLSVFHAIGASPGVSEVAFGIAGAGFAQILLAAPGGAGITEASLVAVFLALGMENSAAAAGVILARLINYAVVAPWGGVCFFALQKRYGRPRDSEPAAAA
jgi:uncharacterized protein (TIRG00374 family)